MNNLYKPFKSKANNKKYSVYVIKNNKVKLIHFGDTRYEHYFDKIGDYSDLNHLDEERRNRYLKRSIAIKDKEGNYTYKDINSPNFWSINFLW